MKKVFPLIFFLISVPIVICPANEIDSLLKVLDKTISARPEYAAEKVAKINNLKFKLASKLSPEEEYHVNESIIDEYEAFICDSAITYIDKNIVISENLNNKELINRSRLRYSFVLSLSGQFTEALEVLDTIKFEKLSADMKITYCWTYIRYYGNLRKYTDDSRYEDKYLEREKEYRNIVATLLDKDSEMYQKEYALKLQDERKYEEAYTILKKIFSSQEPNTHNYAMAAMGLAIISRYMKNAEEEEKHLIIAAITDTRIAVKENEALLALAINLHRKGDVERAYTYMRAALDDAIFYNSRFRNTIISRVHPIIEDTYLQKIEHQKQNLRNYSLLTSLFVIVLIVILYFLYRQIRTVSKAKKSLKIMNKPLEDVNQKLDEVNLIKERYIGYFMNQCAIYIDKLDDYRKNVNRKIKVGQIDDLYKLTSSTCGLEKDVEELYKTFDEAFFEIYPDFVEKTNTLLREDERYKLGKGQLNTELRIYALIRLGITDVNQIAVFLRYSMQTIYNYKSKVKGKAIESENFEEEVKKIGTFS